MASDKDLTLITLRPQTHGPKSGLHFLTSLKDVLDRPCDHLVLWWREPRVHWLPVPYSLLLKNRSLNGIWFQNPRGFHTSQHPDPASPGVEQPQSQGVRASMAQPPDAASPDMERLPSHWISLSSKGTLKISITSKFRHGAGTTRNSSSDRAPVWHPQRPDAAFQDPCYPS